MNLHEVNKQDRYQCHDNAGQEYLYRERTGKRRAIL
jgi:hypothetical protein